MCQPTNQSLLAVHSLEFSIKQAAMVARPLTLRANLRLDPFSSSLFLAVRETDEADSRTIFEEGVKADMVVKSVKRL